jgi:hypothetical protein
MVSPNSPNQEVKTEPTEESKVIPDDLYSLWSEVHEKNPKLKVTVNDLIQVLFGLPIKPSEKGESLENESSKAANKKRSQTPTRKQKAFAEKERAIASTLDAMGVVCLPKFELQLN